MVLKYLTLLVIVSFMVGCKSQPHSGPVTFGKYTDAVRLSNGKVEAIVVPSIRRLVYFGKVNGENVLWSNPLANDATAKPGEWVNHGGDKVWFWPQHLWYQGKKNWPPTMDQAGTTNDVRIVRFSDSKRDSVELIETTPAADEFGVKTVRRYRLEGNSLVITSQVEGDSSESEKFNGFAVWAVTQIPDPVGQRILGRLMSKDAAATAIPLGPGPHDSPLHVVSKASPSVIEIARVASRKQSIKSGFEVDRLAAYRDGVLFIIDASFTGQGTFAPGDRGQVYSHPDDGGFPPAVGTYAELEFTTPSKVPGKAAPMLTTVLSIQDANNFEHAVDIVGRR